MASIPRIRLLTVWAAGFLGVVTGWSATPDLSWLWSNPMPNGNNVYDLAYQSGVTVQAGDRGRLYTSVDGDVFVAHNTGTSLALRAVGFFREGVLVTGESGTTLFAPLSALTNVSTPATFSHQKLPTSDWLEGVAASAVLAVAVGDNGAVYTTANGTNWTRNTVALGTWLRSVAYGNGFFVAVGEGGFIALSSNGTTWQRVVSPVTVDLNRVAWVADRFLAVGNGGVVLVSASGRVWSMVSGVGATGNLYAIGGGTNALTGLTQLVVAGDSEVRAFELGLWTDETAAAKADPAPLWPYYGACYDGLFPVIGGSAGLQVEGVKTNIGTAYAWFDRSTSLRTWLWDIARVEDLYVAVGDLGTIQTSPDGVDWTLELVSGSATNAVFLGVGGRAGLLVVAGSAGTLLTSTNGVTWSPVGSPPVTDDLQGVAVFGGEVYVTGGNGAVLSSTDGRSWRLRTRLGTNFLSSVTSFPGGLAVAGERGRLFTSPDGQQWTARTSGTTNWLSRVRWVDNRLLAVGESGTILTSSDGTNWTARVAGTASWLNDAVGFGGWTYAFGTQGTAIASSNLVDWVPVALSTQKSLYGAATDPHQLLVVGVEGVILRGLTGPLALLDYRRDRGTNAFLLSGPPGRVFEVQSATNTNPWVRLLSGQFLDNAGSAVAVESRTNPPPAELYRGRLLP